MFPHISIIIATYNSERTLDHCLFSIREQRYPQEKIEIILVDAGSTDKTIEIGKKYKCKIINKKEVGAEAAKAYGVKAAKGELIADFGSDNILPEKNWLKKIIRPLIDNNDIIASYPLRYAYRKNDTVFNRYVALFGVNDPIPFYLGKADRQSYLYNNYELKGKIVKEKISHQDTHVRRLMRNFSYFIVEFDTNNLPTVGANGFVIRKKILQKAKVEPENYFHIDVVYDLVKMGYNKFAVVDTSIIHDTADTLFSLLKKRSNYFSKLYLKKKDKRRYHIVSSSDYLKLGLFIFYSLTFIQPLWISSKGYRKKPDIAWLVHPIFCFMIVVIYGYCVLANFSLRYVRALVDEK
jgi:glycosyltransferase involved in cell wall biosynthesis